jgi:hypothetical protein
MNGDRYARKATIDLYNTQLVGFGANEFIFSFIHHSL